MESSAVLKYLTDTATEYGLMVVDPNGNIVYWNEGARRIFLYSRDEACGRGFEMLFTPEDRSLRVAYFELEKARLQGWAEDERWHLRKDGSRFWANGVVQCLRDESGAIIGYSKMVRDQTLRKQTEDSLKSALAELSHFHHAASHDLQEPLRTMRAYLTLARKRLSAGMSAAEVDEYLMVADSGAKRLHTMLRDLLAYVQLGQGKVRKQRTDAAAVCDMAISNLKQQIEECGATVTRTSMPIIQAMPTQLGQLFQNLISNSLKYHRPEVAPLVLIEALPKDDEWVFTVQDNGIGIAPEHRENVFGAFQRLHSKDEYPGSGLGLFICRKIVEHHGGRIWIESSSQHGTRVSFTLQCNPKDEPSCSQGPTADSTPDRSGPSK